MPEDVLLDLDDSVIDILTRRAAAKGLTLEDEIRQILTDGALRPDPEKKAPSES